MASSKRFQECYNYATQKFKVVDTYTTATSIVDCSYMASDWAIQTNYGMQTNWNGTQAFINAPVEKPKPKKDIQSIISYYYNRR